MPDRYADAVRRRRAELRAHHLMLTGGHRAEIRAACAQVRVALAADVARTVAELARQARGYVDCPDRAVRHRLPALLAAAADEARADLRARIAALVLPALRRIAAQRGVLGALVSLPGGAPGRPGGLPGPEPLPGLGRVLAASGSGGFWRLAVLPAATIPVLGLPVGLGLVLLVFVLVARQRWVAAERARLHRWSADAVAEVHGGLDTELGLALLDLEQRAGVLLDAAVAARRTEIEAELQALAPARRTAAADALD
ncbi:hypothetical protein [Pseudonocardia asaccharolytica]|uniref:Uncharacterized protein n=1 Tax=Pseudonocardia asaccharolytica DSM 44247 = NBRC 16224 TaxID=1123024 RepID=A0A511D4C4_9PSEU|nr:hypothetical protein [Pseudonocardia asaccharolytica]GEL19649.1 hypothetical protein PA7_34860 [Pseudonocardia asaccharolytica DSM 44247 = NBRC 16224]